MNELLELLKRHTDEKGYYALYFNEHKSGYAKSKQEIIDYYNPLNDEEINDVLNELDFEKDIYSVVWYKETPVGFYTFYANDINKLIERLKEIEGSI